MNRSLILLAILIAFVSTSCREAANAPPAPNAIAQQPAPFPGEKPPTFFPGDYARNKPMPASVQKLHEKMQQFKGEVRAAYDDPSLWMISFPDGTSGATGAQLAELQPVLKQVDAPLVFALSSDGISDDDLAHLKGLNCFRVLYIGCPKITDAGIANLAGLTNLQNLSLSCPKITDAGMAHLSKLTQLRKLTIYGPKLTDAGLKHLVGLAELDELRFGDESISDAQLAHMKGMVKLKELSIGKKVTDAGMDHLKNLAGLKTLRIDGAEVTAAGLANLAGLKNLEELTILSCSALGGKGLDGVRELPKLKTVEVIYSGIDMQAAKNLAAVKSLERLRLGNAGAETLEGIKDMANLKELDLNYSGLQDDAARHLSGLKSLTRLNLSNTHVTDAGAKHLAGLTNLEWLNMGSTRITDEALQYFSGMTKLKVLYLSECKIKGPGLKHLSGLAVLEDLSLSGNGVGDADLPHLQKLAKLRNLNLTGTQVDDDAVLALKKALPDARIREASGEEVTLSKEPPPPPRQVPDISKSPINFSATAEKYYAEFKAGRDAAKDKYKDKIVELTGTIKDVTSNISGDHFIILESGNKDAFDGINCFTAVLQPWARHAPGQKVKVKGKQSDWHDPTLLYCVIVEAAENPAIAMSAADLAKEYAGNPEATRKKYERKTFLLSGEVAEKKLNSAGAASIRLKADGKVRVTCSMTAFENKLAKTLRPGRQVTLYGQFSAFEDGEVGLNFCLPIKKD